MTVAVLKYSVLRISLFLASLLALKLIGVKASVLMFAAAALISLILSYLLLGGPREQLAQEVASRVEGRIKRRTDVDADIEDAAIDAAGGPDAAAVDVRRESGQAQREGTS